MKTKHLITLIVFAVAIIFSLAFYFLSKISPGSYPYAEKYEVDVDETVLIQAIENFKDDNPKYKVPLGQPDLHDGRNQQENLWYHIYFYYPTENQIIYTWTRSLGKNKTTFAFVSINQGLILGNWKDINKDFNTSENDRQKKIFEDRILNELLKKL